MNTIEKYVAYLKDNPKGYWFKRKVYGWGWTPATREGWMAVAVFLIYVFWVASDFAGKTAGGILPIDEPTSFITKIAVAAVLLIALCYWKGEPPRWQWGFPRDSA